MISGLVAHWLTLPGYWVSIWVTGPLTLNRVTWPLTLDQVSGPLTLDWVSGPPTLDFGHFLNPLAPSKCHHSAKFARNPSFIGAVRYRSTLMVYKCCHTSFFAMFYTFFPNSTDRVTLLIRLRRAIISQNDSPSSSNDSRFLQTTFYPFTGLFIRSEHNCLRFRTQSHSISIAIAKK